MRLEGKVVFISGGARGMGAAEARMFAREGARVGIGDLLEDEGRKVEAQINETGGECLFTPLDVTSESQWQAAISATVSRFGRLDVLVNNAAIFRPERVLETTEKMWDEVMSVNVKGAFLGTKHAIPEMRKAGGGSIINISSGAGLVGSPRGAAYNASKGAVRIFTKAAAVQHAKENIRINSVHPGPIETEMFASAQDRPELRDEVVSRALLGRIGTVDEIAYGVLFLASDESSYVTGAELVIAGGVTAQ